MARTVETGIIITASAKGLKKGVGVAGKGLKGLRKGLSLSGKSVASFGSAYQTGMDVMFKSMEVFSSIKGLLTDTVGAWLEASAKFRYAGDSQLKAIATFKRSTEVLRGSFGDIFTSILAGVSKSVTPMVDSLNKWVKGNREVVGTKIVEWTATLAKLLVNGLAPAIISVSKITSGWRMILAGVPSVFASLSVTMKESMILWSKYNEMVSAIPGRVALFGGWTSEQWAENTKRLKGELTDLEAASDRASANAIKNVKSIDSEYKQLKDTVDKVAKAIEAGVDKAVAAAMKELRAKIKTRRITQEEADAAEAKAEAKRKAKEAADRKRALELLKEQEKFKAEQARISQEIAGAITGTLGAALSAIATGSKTASEAMRDFAIEAATAIAKMLVVRAIQAAVTAYGGGPVAGQIAGGIGGGLFDVGVAKARSGMNAGGYVRGYASGGGVDSVRARLTPGEYVLPKGLVDSIRLGQAPPRASYATGGMVMAGASNAGPSMNITMQTFAVPSRAEFRRWYKGSVAPNVRRLAARGQI